MVRLGAASRVEALAAMADDTLDVLVIGGGITGAGVALDAVARGYRTGLLERRDFASGTSRSSTKLVHGGIRYLPQLDVPLVREALVERGRLLRNAPHLVQPLSFILPLYADARRPVGLPIAPPLGIGLGLILNTGLTFYDGLAGGENIAPHHRLSSAEIARRAPCLKSVGLKTGFAYFDAQTDDTRLTISVLRAAADRGALLANYCAATGFLAEGGVARGVVAESTLETSPEKLTIRARYIVNATGVWAEETERLAGESPMLDVVPSKGTHLVFPTRDIRSKRRSDRAARDRRRPYSVHRAVARTRSSGHHRRGGTRPARAGGYGDGDRLYPEPSQPLSARFGDS